MASEGSGKEHQGCWEGEVRCTMMVRTYVTMLVTFIATLCSFLSGLSL